LKIPDAAGHREVFVQVAEKPICHCSALPYADADDAGSAIMVATNEVNTTIRISFRHIGHPSLLEPVTLAFPR
jgi:hypothetical protein